jgi:threonine aldolase
VIFELNGTVDAAQLLASLLAHGVRMGAMGPRTVRAVTHLDVGAPQIERALEAAANALKEGR